MTTEPKHKFVVYDSNSGGLEGEQFDTLEGAKGYIKDNWEDETDYIDNYISILEVCRVHHANAVTIVGIETEEQDEVIF